MLGLATVGSADDSVSARYVPIRPAPSGAGAVVVVEAGDHLWKITDRSLTDRLGRPARDSEVTPLWRDVIEVNRERIRSGDPDLIYPGEEILVPGG